MRGRRNLVLGCLGVVALTVAGVACARVERSGGRHRVTRPSASASPVPTPTRVIAPTATAPPPATAAVAPSTTAPSADLVAVAGKTITVDPGHDGKNYAHSAQINQPVFIGTESRACDTTGTQTESGYTESAYNLDVALRLRAILRKAGANVVMTRADDNGWGPCINERAAIGNRARADAALSIHADGGPADGRGFHVIYPANIPGYTDDIAAQSYRLALDVRAAYASATGMPFATYLGGGTGLSERSDLGGLNLSDVAKVFIETGNMRNATDATLLTDASYRQRAARAIADGLAAYLSGR